jgi:hypothetical protein
MVLNPRQPNVQNVQCKHDELSGTAEAGAIVYLSGDKKVAKVSLSTHVPCGMLGQRVKANASGLPQNFEFPGEIGASDARLGDPVLVYNGGIFETTHYNLPAGVAAGAPLYAKAGDTTHNSKLVAVASGAAEGHDGNPAIVAEAVCALSTAEAAAGKALLVKLLV